MAGTVYEQSALEGGLRLLRMTIAVGTGALIGGIATQRVGGRLPAIAGVALGVTGFILMSTWDLETGDPALTVHLVVTGLGIGLLVAPIADSALRDVPDDSRGAGSALLTVSRMVGMTAGLAAMTAIGTVQFAELVADVPAFSTDPEIQAGIEAATTDAGLQVFRDFFLYAAGFMAAALAPLLLMTRQGQAERTPAQLVRD
jgi:hypothetical protein